ncbi:MAG: homoserine O-acetyltransferase [Acidimicrobiia bacterium]|nr:MAG: homoserine O-acetyltransferase [Acidimicrobiia bacterium]
MMRHHTTIPGVFSLERGGTLRDIEVEVRTWGKHRSSATLICHALTGNADADDWWGGLFGAGRVFDPSRSFIVAMNTLGGCSGTTGPATIQAGSRRPIGPDFPRVTIRDMVHIQRAVLDELGVTHLDLVIGGSMGGMQALEWAALYPDRVGTIVPIGVGVAQSAWAIGISEAQRHAIVTDPAYAAGRYSSDLPPASGLATARMIAMCSYRSPQNFETRFGRGTDAGTYAVQSYLRYQGDKLVSRFDANSYLTLMDAMDGHDLGRDRGPSEAIVRRITQRALVVGISSDVLYPVTEVRAMAAAMPNARFAVLDSPNGHDAFLIDTDELNALIQGFLSEARPPATIDDKGSARA